MKVILLADVPALGRKGEVKEVSGGHARNFLLPRRLAESATDAALAALTAEKDRGERLKSAEERRYRAAAEKLKNITVSLKMSMGEKGKAFGSVSAAKIQEALAEQGIASEKDWIMLDEPIKTAGEYAVAIKFPHGIAGNITLSVQAQEVR